MSQEHNKLRSLSPRACRPFVPRLSNESGLFLFLFVLAHIQFNPTPLGGASHLIAAICLTSPFSSLRFAQLRNPGTSVVHRFTWCGNVDALHSRLKHLRLWRAGSERPPESSPYLPRVGASAPLGPSVATSRVTQPPRPRVLMASHFFKTRNRVRRVSTAPHK